MVPSEMSPEDPEPTLAGAIAARRWRTSRLGVGVRKLAQGSNNTSYLVIGENERIVIKFSRPHREEGVLDEYRKESWCAGRARELGVLTPEVLGLGVWDGRTFEVQSFVDGRRPLASEEIPTWQSLGDYAQRINSIPVAGWGGSLGADGRFAESWQSLRTAAQFTKEGDLIVGRQVATASLPSFASARRISAAAAGLSGKN
jgi:hypothetical protein